MAKSDNKTLFVVGLIAAGAAALFFLSKKTCPEGQTIGADGHTCVNICGPLEFWDPVAHTCKLL